MASSPDIHSSGKNSVKNLVSNYARSAVARIYGFLPSSDSRLFAVIQQLHGLRRSRRTKKPGLPLPLPSRSLETLTIFAQTSKALELLEEIQEHILSYLHCIQKSLCFWQSFAERTDARKAYFMVFERGPWAFAEETIHLIRGFLTEGSTIKRLSLSASASFCERISVLTHLQHCLAGFLAQFYMEIDLLGEAMTKDLERSLPLLLVSINNLFADLQQFIVSLPGDEKTYSLTNTERVDGSALALKFIRLPDVLQEKSQWTDIELQVATNMTRLNLQRLVAYLSQFISRQQKPSKMTLYWFRYTCGAVGLSLCSAWLLRHSSLTGSSDIDNWIREAKESTLAFWKDHVEMPLLSIRDELFETFRRRHKGVMELEEVQLTANSLHRMLLAFSEQTKGQIFPPDASDQELLEIVMSRYEKELTHPIQNLLGGELARAMLIQIQKLKLDIETAMLELNQILRANEINFAILAALPAFFLVLILVMLVRPWFTQGKGAEGRGRVARIQRRLLLVNVERQIMQYHICLEQGMDKDSQWMYGLVIYTLDRLYRAVERHARATGEWTSLRQDILDLGKPGLQKVDKLTITSHMVQVYDCLLPSPKRLL
ncbi:protein DGS1, mitochondrial isoform X2 [Nymphaea colorata]|uniref:protein DGS1, mitochondrial isoform X2 n=1 Tax=Nymphaea colorata TaxID=210225 RepID=UPI00214E7BD4|nr:protein DGS1, mitochondrial isoform X2 [Nymphaea colorata]